MGAPTVKVIPHLTEIVCLSKAAHVEERVQPQLSFHFIPHSGVEGHSSPGHKAARKLTALSWYSLASQRWRQPDLLQQSTCRHGQPRWPDEGCFHTLNSKCSLKVYPHVADGGLPRSQVGTVLEGGGAEEQADSKPVVPSEPLGDGDPDNGSPPSSPSSPSSLP